LIEQIDIKAEKYRNIKAYVLLALPLCPSGNSIRHAHHASTINFADAVKPLRMLENAQKNNPNNLKWPIVLMLLF